MTVDSDHIELSTLDAQLGEILDRLVAVGDRYRESAISSHCDTVERHLFAARRGVDRAMDALATLR